MADERELPPDLSGWYAELALVWLRFARTCRYHFGQSLNWQRSAEGREWMEMAHKASLRAGRYARLSEEHRTYVEYQADMKLLADSVQGDIDNANQVLEIYENEPDRP